MKLAWKFKPVGLALCYFSLCVASVKAADSYDDVPERTDRALYQMSQLDTGKKKVKVYTPSQTEAVNQAAYHSSNTMLASKQVPLPQPDEQILNESGDTAISQMENEGQYEPTLFDDCNSCGDCGPCCDCLCGPPGNIWVRTEILGWWTKGMNVPPLVTTGPDASQPGILGEPGTEVLFGGGDILERGRVGGRIIAGAWLDDCHTWGIEGDYFGLGDLNQNFNASPYDYEFISRPFENYEDGIPGPNDAQPVNGEDVVGGVNVWASTGFQGAGAMLRRNLCCNTSCCEPGGNNPCNWGDWSSRCSRLDFIGGYRFYRLDDSVQVRERLTLLDLSSLGTLIEVNDIFQTRNEFHGGELGLIHTTYRGRWTLELMAKVALGNNNTRVRINGNTSYTVPGVGVTNYEGGLLAQESNIGTYSFNDFVAIPQFSAQAGYQLTKHLRTFVGYNFLYWANVVRAGDQIDLRVDTNQIPPPLSSGDFPARLDNDSSFWAQGINLGLECRW